MYLSVCKGAKVSQTFAHNYFKSFQNILTFRSPNNFSQMKKTLLLLLLFPLMNLYSKAQEFDYGNYTQAELDMKQYDKDTSAHALVLNEHGTAKIEFDNTDQLKIVYEYHVKIKIFNAKGYDKGNVTILLNNNDQDSETLELIRGVTTYIADDGSAKKNELEQNKIYKARVNKYWISEKFAMPALKDGCIIEYDYITYSPFLAQFPKWNFQSDIPKIHSEYEAHIPGYWTYNAALRGPLKLTKDIAIVERNCFSGRGATSDCAHLTFGMSDIPAFIIEGDMTAPANFLSAISFQLAQYRNLSTGATTKYATTWENVDYDFKHSDTFGAQLRKKGVFKDLLAPVIAGKTDSLEKAIAVYEYIQKNIKWNDFYGTGSTDGTRKTVETHSGSVAEINLALVAALSEAGLNAEAVLLSTRDHGFINKLYPVTNDFNYVIARVEIGNKSYLLDGTEPLLPFGVLPLRCLNDQGRVMSLDKPSYWIDMQNDQKRISTTNFDLTLTSDGKLKGTLTEFSIGYEAYEKRRAIKKFNSVDEYIESLDERSPKYKVLNADISNLDSLDLPLIEKDEVEIKEFNNANSEHLNLNPFLTDHISLNPYHLMDRNYPVDRGMPLSERFTVVVHLPQNYVVESPPELAGFALPNNGGKFETFFQTDNNTFTFSHVVQFNNAVYQPGEYPFLKELFNKIILAEKSPIILKKKS
jgi:hypothetical protein